MTETAVQTRTVTIERDLAHPPAKVWRALTEPLLMEDWLMKNNFEPAVGHSFDFHAEWGSVACQVIAVVPLKTLTYSWNAHGLESTVTWTLTPTAAGTRLRMDQVGFRPDQEQAYHGAQYGWPRFLAKLEQVLARIT